jgi:hypothetical protein
MVAKRERELYLPLWAGILDVSVLKVTDLDCAILRQWQEHGLPQFLSRRNKMRRNFLPK